jgi:hypothetical protein
MATRFDINVFSKELMQDIEAKAIVWVNKGLNYLLSDIIQKSPVDTWEYLKWNKIKKAEKIGTQIYWEVFNESENAENIEYWFRKSPVNWHKNRKKWWPIIYTWVGARVYSRSADNNQENIKNIIKKEIW